MAIWDRQMIRLDHDAPAACFDIEAVRRFVADARPLCARIFAGWDLGDAGRGEFSDDADAAIVELHEDWYAASRDLIDWFATAAAQKSARHC